MSAHRIFICSARKDNEGGALKTCWWISSGDRPERKLEIQKAAICGSVETDVKMKNIMIVLNKDSKDNFHLVVVTRGVLPQALAPRDRSCIVKRSPTIKNHQKLEPTGISIAH
ncbi:MAG: hypothetical protein AB4426_33740 [Xenococcaceae cyanobacterium]